MENAINIAAPGDSISILSLITQASLLVQLVMLSLLVASIVSWTMIFSKHYRLKSAFKIADEFENDFWSGGDMTSLFQQWSGRRTDAQGVAAIFVAGFREFSRLSKKGAVDRADMLDAVHRAMRVAMSWTSCETTRNVTAIAGRMPKSNAEVP